MLDIPPAIPPATRKEYEDNDEAAFCKAVLDFWGMMMYGDDPESMKESEAASVQPLGIICRDSKSQTMMIPRSEHERMCFPSGEKKANTAAVEWSSNMCTASPVGASQTRTVLS